MTVLRADHVRNALVRHAEFPLSGHITRDAGDGAPENAVLHATGYGVVFGSRNSYGEVFVPGCFEDSLRDLSDEKPLPWIDWHRHVIGRWTRATQELRGLRLDGFISDTAQGRDHAQLLRDGAMTGLSIGFSGQDLEVYVAEPGETVTFDTPFGPWTCTHERWTYYIVRARLVEVSTVPAPSDDEARLTSVRSGIPLEKAAVALPGLAAEADWADVAWSMCRVMGAPGAGLADLEPAEREALHKRLAAGYERHDRTPPDFTPDPTYADVQWRHDEPALYRDRSLGKRCADVIAASGALDRPLSDETRARATEARDALDQLLAAEPSAEPDEIDWSVVRDGLQRAHATLTTEGA